MADKKRMEARLAVLDQKERLILDPAEREGHGLTDQDRTDLKTIETERQSITARLDLIDHDDETMAELNRLKGQGQFPRDNERRVPRVSFKGSAFERYVLEHRGQLVKTASAWQTPPLEFIGFGAGDALMAATLTEDPSSGGQLVVPDVEPEIHSLPTRPLVVANLIGQGPPATSNAVTFMAEKTIDNQAAAVAPGGLKPQSSIAFEAKTEPVKKVATWLEAVEEIMEDVAGLYEYIRTRLMHFVQLEEDDQLLNGDGTGANFSGILTRPGLAPPIARAAGENNADVLLRASSAIYQSSGMEVDGYVLHPNNWDALLLLKDADGNYIAGGGPFGTPQRKTLWGRDVAVTPAQAEGTAAVGAWKTGARLRRRSPLRVQAANTHADFFIKNLIALVAEERAALLVYREGAFGVVTNLTAPPPAAP